MVQARGEGTCVRRRGWPLSAPREQAPGEATPGLALPCRDQGTPRRGWAPPESAGQGARRGSPSSQLFCSSLLACPRNPRPWTWRAAQRGPCGATGPTTWRPRARSSGASPARRSQAPPWVEPQLGVRFQESEMSPHFCMPRPPFCPAPWRPSCRKQGGSWLRPPSSLAWPFPRLPQGRAPARRPRPSATCWPWHPVLRETPGPPTLPASGDLLSRPARSAGDLGLGGPLASPLAHRDRNPCSGWPPTLLRAVSLTPGLRRRPCCRTGRAPAPPTTPRRAPPEQISYADPKGRVPGWLAHPAGPRWRPAVRYQPGKPPSYRGVHGIFTLGHDKAPRWLVSHQR